MTSTILRLLQPLSRWLGWSRVVLVVQRDDEVLVSTLPRDLPVAVRLSRPAPRGSRRRGSAS
jgi:hypothetical protein